MRRLGRAPRLDDVIVRFTASGWDPMLVIVTVEQGLDDLEDTGWHLYQRQVRRRDDVKSLMARLLSRGATVEAHEADGRFTSRRWKR